MKIRSTQGKNNTHFSFRYELISYTFDILHKISKNANKFQTFSFTNLVEAKRTNCCLLLTNSIVSNLQDHWVHDHWGDRTLVLFSFPISWELFLFPWVNDAVGRLGFWLAHVDELAKRGTVLVIGINAERLGKISQRLFLFGVVDSSQARLDDGMTDGTVAVGAVNEPFISVECSVIVVWLERSDTSIPLSTDGDIWRTMWDAPLCIARLWPSFFPYSTDWLCNELHPMSTSLFVLELSRSKLKEKLCSPFVETIFCQLGDDKFGVDENAA